MLNVNQTIISQYANSPTINQLIESMNGYIDPRTNMENFYDFVWNVDTAEGFGLDIWGKIVGVVRTFKVTLSGERFGFDEGLDYQPFNQAPFYNPSDINSVTLDDTDYRRLIMIKALANISVTTAQSMNKIIRELFPGRVCYVVDTGNMTIRYFFGFTLTPEEYGILTQSGAMPKPAGVKVEIFQIDPDVTFGFAGSDCQPFGEGAFISVLT